MTTWDTATLGTVCSTYSGGTPSTARPDFYGGDIPWIASADLNQGRIRSVKGRITKLGLDRSSAKLVEVGTPLIALYGATAGAPAITYVRGAINQAVLAMVPKRIDAEFLYQWLKANRDEIIDRFTQGGQPNLSGAIVRSIEVPLPPAPEQCRISRSLRDADELISALERMITKKQAIKQGMMQQLLTGKTRLPGFSSQWDEVSLGESGTVSGGGVDKASNPGEATVQLLNYMDVYRAEFIGADTVSQVVTAPPAKISKCTIRAGDVFFTPTSEVPDDIARSAVAECDLPGAVYSYHLVRWRPSGDWDPSYLGFAFATERFRAQASTLAAGSGTRYVVSMPGFRSLLAFRPPIEEQRAIGNLLRDASLEIELLGRRLAKARAAKVGMMQELLTGRTRLPVEEGAA